MDFLAELLVCALIVIGGIFGLVGSYGLVKLPDLMTRLHSPTKASSLGIGGVLLASMVYGVWQNGWLSTHELLVTLFIFLTAPITANFIAKAFLHRERDKAGRLPPTGTPYGWASYDAPPETDDDEPGSLAGPRSAGN